MPTQTIITVRAVWDPEAKVWIATSDDVPGLVTEADTPAELEAKLQVMIPDLLEASRELVDGDRVSMREVDLCIRLDEQRSRVSIPA